MKEHRTLNTIVKNIKRYKGVFIPGETEYKHFLFEFSYKLLDCYHTPVDNHKLLNRFMEEQALRTEKTVMGNYWKWDNEYGIYVPSLQQVDALVTADIRDGHHRITIDKLVEELK